MKILYIHMISKGRLPILMFLVAAFICISCEDFVEIDNPDSELTGDVVFDDPTTVEAAIIDIYSQMRDNALSSGGSSGVGYLMGHYADELTLFTNEQPALLSFYENSLLPSNDIVLNVWNSSYNLIYAANAIKEGVEGSDALSEEERSQFLGEVLFIRAYLHFYLTNLYGSVPYVQTTDYLVNSEIPKSSTAEVYENVVLDLLEARELLPTTIDATNTRPNKWVATSLLSRAYLYSQQWELARTMAEEVLNSGPYSLNESVSDVFLKNSSETIWQFDASMPGANTIDALTYVFVSGPPPNTALSAELVESFETGDERFADWVGTASNGTETWYHPFKYKLNSNTGETQELSIVIRLAELYLISAEANARLGNIAIAQQRLNTIRNRAGLSLFSDTDTTALLDAILHERRIELFTEHGHRWFDLKRTERATEQLTPIKPNWDPTDVVLPIPEAELLLNPNLLPQNDGY
ncbi:RagB/SusD family nutrient uptake outer membrane protein [Luteirhabdus pelagi]|uniref:RagB/SusD family nutrient uptake outer membrane protein n=1 Tax=Luteirhabdus pelagi TaxID=2792783 RepID=UPI0019398F41|nr:RagB/SusD family nutrient uptake outer membrane protein [Luteirhabdus pelagi]